MSGEWRNFVEARRLLRPHSTEPNPIEAMNGNLIVYRASAGTGKTFTLAAEYIAMLLSDDHMYRHILAVTFTNKAKEEMKERILQYLYDLSPRGHMTPDDGFAQKVCKHELLRGTGWEEVRRRAGTALGEILHDYDRFRVETIDSFFQSVLQNLARELGVAANFRVSLDDAQVVSEAVDRLLLSLADRPDLRAWVLNYMEAHFRDGKGYNVARELKKFASELSKDNYRDNAGRLAGALEHDFLAAYRQEMDGLAKEIDDHLSTFATHIAERIEESGEADRISHVKDFYSYLKRIYTGQYTKGLGDRARQKIDGAAPWGAKGKPQPSDAFVEEIGELMAELERMREQSIVLYNTARLCVARLYPLRLLHAIGSEVDRINESLDRVMLSETPRFLRDVSREDAPFVFEKSGTQFRHILIDEFQDTSRTQWADFLTLIVENLAQGNECFLVGDVKQSIYRFRGGDASLLGNIEQTFPSARVERLDVNFRSAPAIIDFNNFFFPRAAEKLAASARLFGSEAEQEALRREGEPVARIYREKDVFQHCAHPESPGYVQLYIDRSGEKKKKADDSDTPAAEPVSRDERQCLRLCEKIRTLRDDCDIPLGQMTILLQRNDQIRTITDFFARNCPDVPVVSDEAFYLTASSAVMYLVRALAWLYNPADSEARAYLVKKNCDASEAWTSVVARSEAPLPAWLGENRAKLLAMPLYELCMHIVEQAALASWPGQSAYLFGFLDGLAAYLDEHRPSLRHFLAYWDETLSGKAIASGDVDGVRILTIHKAKGLDAHTVLLPFLEGNIDAVDFRHLMWCATEGRLPKRFSRLPLIPVAEGLEAGHSLFAPYLNEEMMQKRLERLNLLYVAFTRARKNMVVWTSSSASLGKKKDTPAAVSVGRLVYETLVEGEADALAPAAPFMRMEQTDEGLVLACGTLENYTLADETEKLKNPLKFSPESRDVRLDSGGRLLRFRGSKGARALLGRGEGDDSRRRRGLLLHEMFAWLATAADIEPVVRRYAREGYISEADVPGLTAFLHACLEQPAAAPWFDGSWRLFNECSILSLDKNGRPVSCRPDRVMMKDGRTVVVDFKFGAKDDEYKTQVERYVDLLRRMGHSCVEGWIWYVKLGETERI